MTTAPTTPPQTPQPPVAPTVPAPTTAPAPVVPPPTAPALPVTTTAPIAPAPETVAASRRSVHLLAAAVGTLAVACLLYVLVDRPGLQEPLVAVAAIVAAATGVAGLVRGASRPPR
ncbi:hypothetical protein AB0O39_37735 [Streptomyces anulatus]|uniref:hypothetical protein n=1 Tax=Streptomyces anulatus TaxID=1892 RepID=UPI00342C00FC